jgi:hypothetical protein
MRTIKTFRYLAALAVVAGAAALASAVRADDGILTPEQARVSREAKLAVEQQMRLTQDAAQAAPRAPKVDHGPSSPTVAPLPTGLFQTGQAPFSSRLYKIENQWQGVIGSELIRVYAGAKTADPSQGVLVILTNDVKDLSDRTPQSGGLVLSPGRSGGFRIVSAEGTRLTLTNPGGQTFVFDVATRSLTRS